MYKNLHEIDWMEMQRDIQAELESLGYEYINDRPMTTHPNDWYLRIVLGRNERGYTTWVFNASIGGLHSGHYDQDGGHDYLSRQ